MTNQDQIIQRRLDSLRAQLYPHIRELVEGTRPLEPLTPLTYFREGRWVDEWVNSGGYESLNPFVDYFPRGDVRALCQIQDESFLEIISEWIPSLGDQIRNSGGNQLYQRVSELSDRTSLFLRHLRGLTYDVREFREGQYFHGGSMRAIPLLVEDDSLLNDLESLLDEITTSPLTESTLGNYISRLEEESQPEEGIIYLTGRIHRDSDQAMSDHTEGIGCHRSYYEGTDTERREREERLEMLRTRFPNFVSGRVDLFGREIRRGN